MPSPISHDSLSLAALVKKGEVTPLELCEAAIQRIEKLNPQLNAVIYKMYDEARRVAKSELPNGSFKGVPFLLKDLITTYAGTPHHKGCKGLKKANYISPSDNELMRRFRAAGLVVLGKTNTPEFGMQGITEPEAYGITVNPWDASRTPGGSSGGSCAAVASGMVPMASGGDGGGSIRNPASCCGLFGFKPSRGRMPMAPNGEMWHGAVTEHVLTRSVRDSAAMLDAVHGDAPGMPYLIKPPEMPYLQAVSSEPGELKIAFSTASPFGAPVHKECVKSVENTAKLLENLGHHVEEIAPVYNTKEVGWSFIVLYLSEAAHEVDMLQQALGRKARRSDVELMTWTSHLLGKAHSALELTRATDIWNKLARVMGQFHQEYDLFVTPTMAVLPPKIGSMQPKSGEQFLMKTVNTFSLGKLLKGSGIVDQMAEKNLGAMPFTFMANITGQPAMSVPMHWSEEGLPVGVHFTSAIGKEGLLFSLAGQLERAAPWFEKVPPIFADS